MSGVCNLNKNLPENCDLEIISDWNTIFNL